MGKRSSFERVPRDFYPTPEAALIPLLPHLQPHTKFSEPCAGNGALIRHLEAWGHHCYWRSDIEPQEEVRLGRPCIQKVDALTLTNPLKWADCIITNPPWDRKILHPMIDHFRQMNTVWLLFDADWCHTRQSATYIKYCSKIVSVGRVKWIPDSKMTGKDNCAWYRFEPEPQRTVFYGRV